MVGEGEPKKKSIAWTSVSTESFQCLVDSQNTKCFKRQNDDPTVYVGGHCSMGKKIKPKMSLTPPFSMFVNGDKPLHFKLHFQRLFFLNSVLSF